MMTKWQMGEKYKEYSSYLEKIQNLEAENNSLKSKFALSEEDLQSLYLETTGKFQEYEK